MQCDLWFPPVDVPLGFGQVARPPVLVIAACYSRMMFAAMIASRQGPDLVGGALAAAVPGGCGGPAAGMDNEAAVGSWRAGKPKLTDEFEAFRGTLGVGVHQCRPRDPRQEDRGTRQRLPGDLVPARAGLRLTR
jgi:hypothetical protein